MSRKTVIIIVLLFSVPLAVYLLMPSDTKRIKKLIKEGKDAIVSKDLEKTMGPVSYNYRDRYGFTYLYIKETLKSLFARTDVFDIDLKGIKVDVNDDRAEARFLVKVAGLHGDKKVYILGTEDLHESVVFTLEKKRMRWKVVETYFPTREGTAF